MSFSDEDMHFLKNNENALLRSFKISQLIKRLQAAEKVFSRGFPTHSIECDSATSCCAPHCICGADEDYEIWKKSCGR